MKKSLYPNQNKIVPDKNPRKMMAQNYESWMLPAITDWLNDGWSLYSFPSKQNVSSKVWARLLSEAPELQEIKQQYLSKIKKAS